MDIKYYLLIIGIIGIIWYLQLNKKVDNIFKLKHPPCPASFISTGPDKYGSYTCECVLPESVTNPICYSDKETRTIRVDKNDYVQHLRIPIKVWAKECLHYPLL